MENTENRYRVWCNDKNEWEKDNCILTKDGLLLHQMGNGHYAPLKKESHIVEFYISRKDANGIEICKGDLMQTDTIIKVVVYNESLSRYGLQPRNGGCTIDISECDYVVGTIHDRGLPEAVKLLTTSIKNDPDLKLGYQANIAMAFVDAAEGIPGFKGVPTHVLHLVARNAADRFLQNWCKQ